MSKSEAHQIVEKTDKVKKAINSKLVTWFFEQKPFRVIFTKWLDRLDETDLNPREIEILNELKEELFLY